MDELHIGWAKARRTAVGMGTFSRAALDGFHINPASAGGTG